MKTLQLIIPVLATCFASFAQAQTRQANPAPAAITATPPATQDNQKTAPPAQQNSDTAKTQKPPVKKGSTANPVDNKLAVSDEGVPADKSGKTNKKTAPPKPASGVKKPTTAVSPR